MIDSAEEDLKEEEMRVVVREDVSPEMKVNNHTIPILEARTFVVVDLTN
jgi:hypothetical protein